MFIKKVGNKKRFIALFLLICILVNNVPSMRFTYASVGQDISWSQEALDAASAAKYIPTGLAYHTSVSGINLEYGVLGHKQYLSGSSDKYSDFTNRMIYCVNLHQDNGSVKVEGTQAFHSNIYNVNKMPKEFLLGVPEEQKKFNFLVLTYAAAYKSKQDPKTLDPYNANVGVDILVTCGRLVTLIAEYAPLTGNWEEDFAWFKSWPYKEALGAAGPVNFVGDPTTYQQLISTDIPQWTKDKGCENRAQAIFCYVWTAAKLSSHVTIESNRDTWRYEAALEEDGMYHVRIPFEGDNQYIMEYLRVLQAECFGDWTRKEDTACVHFISPTGSIPSEGGIAKLTALESEGMIARNLSEAKLYEFKFYCYSTQRSKYGFNYTQTYFSSVMERPLEIYLVLGAVPAGGSSGIEIHRYEHDESWNADYNVNLDKFDAETGKPLEGAHFDILEAFDDSQLEDTELDMLNADGSDVLIGSLNATSWGDDSVSSNYNGDTGLLWTKALKYNWANASGSQFERWDNPEEDPCIDDDDITDANGFLTYRDGIGESTGEPAHFDVRSYRYNKGYCSGHPAPIIEYEEPDEDGDGEAVDAYNQQLHDTAWAAWFKEVETCAALTEEGGFFHAIEPGTAVKAMEADRDQFYEDFISLTYDYSAKEIVARKGYILHGLHADDVPIEWRTVTSSQYKDFIKNGAAFTKRKDDAAENTEEIETAGDTQEGRKIDGEEDKPSFVFIDESGNDGDIGKGDDSLAAASNAEVDTIATSSEAKETLGQATPSNAFMVTATASDAVQRNVYFTGLPMGHKDEMMAFFRNTFLINRQSRSARESVSFLPSEAPSVIPGEDDILDWTFILYDHRTEGEIHINKRDLDLEKNKKGSYDTYGDTQGDAALEGAVYGLFASEDIVHPDGRSAAVFKKDDLVAIATTDQNGDASFLAITEAPGTHFNYQAGKLERTGFTGPENLFTSREKADLVSDSERFEGHSADGASLLIEDSRAGDEAWYQKLSSNQGIDGTGESGQGYSIQNNQGNNGNCWIGRPLILGQEGSRYYVMELARSEGYELSRYGVDASISNREADAAGALPSSEGSVSISPMDFDKRAGYNQFTVTSKDTANGYDILIAGLREGAKFYITKKEIKVNPEATHTEHRPVKDPVYGKPGSQVIIGKTAIEAKEGDRISLPNGSSATVSRVSEAKQLRIGVRPSNAFRVEPPVIAGENQPASAQLVAGKINQALKKAGYREPEEGSPWICIPLSGAAEADWCQAVNAALEKLKVFNAISLREIYQEGGKYYGLFQYTYLQAKTAPASLYDENRQSVWVKKKMTYKKEGASVEGYLYVEYPEDQCEDVVKNSAGFLTSATVKKQELVRDTALWKEDLSLIGLRDEKSKSYWVYGELEQAYDNKGNPVYNTRYEMEEVSPGYEEKTTETQIASEYDSGTKMYTVHIAPAQIPEDGVMDYRIRYEREYVEGTNLPYPYYVQQNAILSVLPSLAAHDSYIRYVTLMYPGQDQVYQDAGTRERPVRVLERVIRQRVKIIKDITTAPDGTYEHNTNADSGHMDEFIDGFGGTEDVAEQLDNFRFKIYLKSNLERLYRDEGGNIIWLDHDGGEVENSDYRANYPKSDQYGAVQKLYTRTLHQTDSKTTGSVSNNIWEDAVTANSELYSYDDGGRILSVQNPGYTRLLETITKVMEDGAGKTRQISEYNYEKFFAAIWTANYDKWDRRDDVSISGTDHTNASVSAAVLQFAVTWYLDDETAKLTEGNGREELQPERGSEAYQNQVYDQALHNAIEKAKNYLKPFFSYDLDEIYAVQWDSEKNGGPDRDPATLAASVFYPTAGNGLDISKDGYYYGVSKYLPYGVYVAVEQQPGRADLGDFYNKHYKTDKPREITLPSIYEPGGNDGSPEALNHYYEYDSSDTPEALQRKYHIRLNEEWPQNSSGDLRSYVIRAHNNDGDYEIYKYGLDVKRLTGTISYAGGDYAYQGFTIAQEPFDPYKDVYRRQNAASFYPINREVEQYYHYASISENAGTADHVKTVTGSLTAWDGRYAAALVPWTVTEPTKAGTYDPDKFTGYADGKYRNTFYTTRLRIEKLDLETGENILHDGAIFAIYSAKREDARESDGRVKFYEKDTVISGSKEFLEAMGAGNITPAARMSLPWQIPYMGKYFGTVGAGTPVCSEKEQIILKDGRGQKTGRFRVVSTTGDQRMADGAALDEKKFADQNVGYLETPQPLGAGCYVLAELKPPSGYARSKPVAIEIYSDQVAYYQNGNRDLRVVAAVYEDAVTKASDKGAPVINPEGSKPSGSKPRDKGETARVRIDNSPICLEISKMKPDDDMATYELNGRLEGSIIELNKEYGLENLELAYNASKTYLGYGWKKGFLEALKQKQAAGESIEILYENGVFTGKAKLFKAFETGRDVNRYLPGAKMTLFDAIEVRKNGDREDYQYDGVNVERDWNGNVKNIYVQKGYAGSKIRYVLDRTDPDGTGEEDYRNYSYDNQEDDKGAGVWIAKTVERESTDILFFDLGNLSVLSRKSGALYGYDKAGKEIRVKNGEPIFALKNGSPFLEILSSDYEGLHYSEKDHVFTQAPQGTKVYHLDAEGGRDSEVNPYTGMAYVVEAETGKILVWPVKLSFDTHGNVIAREKIATSRIATIFADTEEEYTVGTYDGLANRLKRRMNPALNRHGLPVYYQRSDETYQKGRPVYDRDGDYVRYQYDDKLKAFNDNAYQVETNRALLDIGDSSLDNSDDRPLYHRQGESYLMENTWITGDKALNDPFANEITAGQADILKRIPAGNYIMEEVRAPEGYGKIMPVGITIRETARIQSVKAEDFPIAAYFEKLDAPADYRSKILDRDGVLEEEKTVIEGKGGFSYKAVENARLSLYRAKRVPSNDLEAHPSGYYLEKKEEMPASWTRLDAENRKVAYTASWTTDKTPKYLESIPKGDYILEEAEAPSGYVRSSLEVEIKEQGGLQYFTLLNDHTKLEIFKYREEGGRKIPLENKTPAKLALFEAVTDKNGIVMKDGVPQYNENRLVEQWTTDDCCSYSEGKDSFAERYKTLFEAYGTDFQEFFWKKGEEEQRVSCISSQTTDRGECIRQLWEEEDGKRVLVHVTKNLRPEGAYGNIYDFKFNYKEIKTNLCPNAVSYDTASGTHRIDYLPLNGKENALENAAKRKGYYVLTEIKAPDGFASAQPKAIVIEETADIQLYSLKNEPKYIEVEKMSEDGIALEGAKMALYRAAGDGSLLMDEAHLAEAWESEFGQRHRISPIPFGSYYLVELKAPSGYEKMEPKKIEVTPDSNVLVTAVDPLKKGRIIIEKEDQDDSERKLSGAQFEVKNKDTGESFILVTDESGRAESGILAIGKTGKNGIFLPYIFSIREIAPPDTYQLDFSVHEFEFEDNQDSYLLTYTFKALDAQTEIAVSKSIFGSSASLEGAKLAVYGTKTENGVYEAQGEAVEEWISDGTDHIIRGKLSAGRTYLLKELQAPKGYNLAAPLLFSISDDGRKITYVSDDRNIIKFENSSRFMDAVESITVLGRLAVRVELELTDLDTGESFQVPFWQERPLTVADGLINGHRYEKKEITYYSDGNSRVSGRTVFRLRLREDGSFPVNTRREKETRLRLEDRDGEKIETWVVKNKENSGYAHTVYNPEYADCQGVEVVSANGRFGAGVMPESVIKYRINWKNTSKEEKDIRIEAEHGPEVEFMEKDSTPGGRKIGQKIVWNIHRAAPEESGSVILTVAVGADAEGEILNRATIGSKRYTFSNPLLEEGGLTLRNQVSGTAREELENRDYSYEITLLDTVGKPLKGFCPYTGSRSGRIKSGDTVNLKGGEFITLTGMAWGTRYQVIDKSDGTEEGLEQTARGAKGVTGKRGANALFMYRKNDGAEREIFKKGKAYRLIESTVYSDGEEIETNEFSFRLNEQAAVDNVTMEDKPTQVRISKTDITGEKELPGATMALEKLNGEVIDEWISGEEPHELEAVLEPGESYILTEVSPPDGYAFERQLTFTVSDDGVPMRVAMEDQETQVEIIKLSKDGHNQLKGAILELRDSEGKLIEKWTTDGTVHRLVGRLRAGETYTLSELVAPAGYRKAGPVTFTVSERGEVDKVVIEDPPTRVLIEKRAVSESGNDSGLLLGAHIQITDLSGNMVCQFLSKEVPEEITGILTAGGVYIAKEIEAPYGYELAEPVEFTVPEDDAETPVITICIKDKKKPVPPESNSGEDRSDKPEIILRKYDGITLSGLPGAVFAIYQEDGRLSCTVETKEDGRVRLPELASGRYTAIEIKAPAGYLLSGQEHGFTVDDRRNLPKELLIPNYPAEEVTIAKEDQDTGERLSGAELQIFDEEGNPCGQGKTDENGTFTWLPARAGTYMVVEIKAPKGYQLQKDAKRFTVAASGETTRIWIVKNKKIEPGFITAFYEPNTEGLEWNKNRGPYFPKTGDESLPLWGIAAGLLMSFVLMLCTASGKSRIWSNQTLGQRRKKIEKQVKNKIEDKEEKRH